MNTASAKNGLIGLLASLAIIAGVVFFSYAALQGQYGLFRLFQVKAQESQLLTQLHALQDNRAQLANRTRRLSSQYLDLDLLDEQTRKVLGMARGDEIIIRSEQ